MGVGDKRSASHTNAGVALETPGGAVRTRLALAFFTILLFAVASRAMPQASAPPGGVESRSFFVGPSIMIDHTTNHFDPRPHAIGVEADYILSRVGGLGAVSLPARAHYWSNFNPLGDGVPHYNVTSLAAGLAYHPMPDRRLDPYAGVMLRFRRRTGQADSTTVDPLLDAGARLHLGRRVFVQAGMSFDHIDTFGLWRFALMFKL